ncbi:MAG TPA: hypothetical protein H9830_07755 [Candidatus Agrococcus pullicola]|uniref:Uncharacterized protein n=1 Tax=Candidatus Agrococcus pullicola TaxID=2838429 RepID=A0A9D2C9S6_9MICO|nr:hypothetical protein [Candidatus Agrococcus pullicola]
MEVHASGGVFGAVVELEQPLTPGTGTAPKTEAGFSSDDRKDEEAARRETSGPLVFR